MNASTITTSAQAQTQQSPDNFRDRPLFAWTQNKQEWIEVLNSFKNKYWMNGHWSIYTNTRGGQLA